MLQIVGSNPLIQVKEQSVCDLEQKKLTIHSQNVSCFLMMSIASNFVEIHTSDFSLQSFHTD